MEKFKSFTEFEEFVERIRGEYLAQTENHPFAHTAVDRFLVQVNTDLKTRGFEIDSTYPFPQGSIEGLRGQITGRLFKGGIKPERLPTYNALIQPHVDSIEKTGS